MSAGGRNLVISLMLRSGQWIFYLTIRLKIKQGPTDRSTADKSLWETAVKSLKIAVGVAGVGLALYAAYKYFG